MRRLPLYLLGVLVATVCGAAVFISVANAQTQRTTAKRAVEVIDAYLDSVATRADQRTRQTLEVDGLAALLMLPGDDRTVSLLRRMDEISRAAPWEWQIESGSLKAGALGLAVRRGDLVKAKALVDGGAKWKYVAEPIAERLASLDLERALALVDQIGDEALWDTADKLCRMGRVDLVRSIVEARPDRPWGSTLYAELGLIPQLERELANVEDRHWNGGDLLIERLVKVAYILARNGDLPGAQRTAEQVLSVQTPVSLATLFMSPRRTEECEWRLPSPLARFQRGSIIVWGEPPLIGGHSYPPKRSALKVLAWALASRGPDDRSRELLRRLRSIAEMEVERVKIDPAERAALEEQLKDPARASAADRRLVAASSGLEAKYGIAFAQFIVGEKPEPGWRVPGASSIVEFVVDFPRAGLVERVLAERDRLGALKQTDPKAFADLWLNLNIIAGKGDVAREALTIDWMARGRHDLRLRSAIAAMHKAGMRNESHAAVDAYIVAHGSNYDHWDIVHLLILQDRRESLIRVLRGNLEAASHLDRFIAVGVLNELGERVEVMPQTPKAGRQDPQDVVSDWGGRVDILAWLGRIDELEALIQNPPAEFAALSAENQKEGRAILEGLLAVALARQGFLEEALRLVSKRSLEGRFLARYGAPVFSVPHLVYEWTVRGHANQ